MYGNENFEENVFNCHEQFYAAINKYKDQIFLQQTNLLFFHYLDFRLQIWADLATFQDSTWAKLTKIASLYINTSAVDESPGIRELDNRLE